MQYCRLLFCQRAEINSCSNSLVSQLIVCQPSVTSRSSTPAVYCLQSISCRPAVSGSALLLSPWIARSIVEDNDFRTDLVFKPLPLQHCSWLWFIGVAMGPRLYLESENRSGGQALYSVVIRYTGVVGVLYFEWRVQSQKYRQQYLSHGSSFLHYLTVHIYGGQPLCTFIELLMFICEKFIKVIDIYV